MNMIIPILLGEEFELSADSAGAILSTKALLGHIFFLFPGKAIQSPGIVRRESEPASP